MKSVFRVALLALVLGVTAARAESGYIPKGLKSGEWEHVKGIAKDLRNDIFAKHGKDAGYTKGEQLTLGDGLCMLYTLAEGAMKVAIKRVMDDGPKAARYRVAAGDLAEKALEECKKGGPPPGNRAIQMLKLAGTVPLSTDLLNRDNSEALTGDWRKQMNAILRKDEWSASEMALVGTVIVVLLAREALPVP